MRNQLDTTFERENFERYWLGLGDLELTDEQFQSIVSTLSSDMVINNAYHIGTGEAIYYAYKFDFYDTEFDGLLGSAWVIFDKSYNAVGLYDRYDFNAKAWSDRTLSNHIKTFGVRLVSPISSTAKPFTIRYGKTSDSLP